MSREIWLTLPDGREYELEGRLTIGRSSGNDLMLPSPKVSREHAVIEHRQGRWYVEDLGSYNGTLLNDNRVRPGVPLPLRHADRIEIGSQTILFSWPAQASDPDATETAEELPVVAGPQLSPLQAQIVHCLCDPWLAGASLESLPSNEQIAALLGTPGAAGTVKAVLRRVYVKAGITGMPAHAKRRALCRVARQKGWV